MPTRREALKRGTAVLAGAAVVPGARRGGGARSPAATRVAALRVPGFPTVDCTPLGEGDLTAALAGLDVAFLGLADLARLTPAAFDVLVTPYGSAFPKAAWPHLLRYLTAGGNWVHLGGVPFALPHVRDGAAWRAEVRQTAYHKQLGLTQAFPVTTPERVTVRLDPAFHPGLPVMPRTTWAGYYGFTRTKAVPEEDGSDGPREAVLDPLEQLAVDGTVIASPVVRIDRLEGPCAGGRWVLALCDAALSPDALRVLVDDASLGVRRLAVRSTYACYREGETPAVTVTLRSSAPAGAPAESCRVELRDAADRVLARATVALAGGGAERTGRAELPLRRAAPGLYRVQAEVTPRDAGVTLAAETGFWIFDAALLAGGRPLTTDEFSLLREGAPYPVTGTTYMASDVHRRFLFEPNPAVWDADFAAMKAAGVTLIRTGIWTGWRRYMSEPGRFDEATLRALDAFLLTARRYDIPVIFTCFAFLPETWGGENAYLDPAAVRAQRTFVTTIAQRYRAMNDVLWDLINEPSFCSPSRLWQCRPNYDRHEQAAWQSWLQGTFPAADDAERAARLGELWRTTPGESLDLPRLEEFGERSIFETARPLKTTAYRLFAQAMFARWAREMAGALREVAPQQLVMVGQDEGGTGESPSQHFFGEAMDLTSIHNWWLNDDLLWDSVVTKVPGKPNLVQETGIMFAERMDGAAWRTEEEARDLLERKLAIALATSAGYVEWIWNTNCYMPIDNEAAIGLLRVDGSAKPEFFAWRQLNAFGAALRGTGPRERDQVVLVIPHANQYSSRNTASDATKRAVRALGYHNHVSLGAVSEYGLRRLGYVPKLLVVPSPRVLTEDAWRALVGLAEAGATVLVTGPFEADEWWRPAPRLERWGVRAAVRPVAQSEDLDTGRGLVRLSYRGERMLRCERADVEGDRVPGFHRFPAGSGGIVWAPLPVELAQEIEPAAAVYREALSAAGVSPSFTVEHGDPGVLVYRAAYRDAVLYAMVSELGRPSEVRLADGITGARVVVPLPAQRAALVLLGRPDGRILARCDPTG